MDHDNVFKGVEESGRPDVPCAEDGSAESANAKRSMVASDSFDAAVLAYPRKSVTPQAPSGEIAPTCLVGSICEESHRERSATPVRKELGVLGKNKGDEAETVCTQIPTQVLMKPGDLCRTMNSTPLGRVLDERQLLRHRTRSEFPLEVGRKIDFLKYAAWLSETHQSRIERKNSPVPEMGSISAAKVLKLLNLQQRRCALSGRPLVPETAALDHVLPISRGGKHNIDNAQVLHKDVNRAKGALTNDEFVALCREVAAWAE